MREYKTVTSIQDEIRKAFVYLEELGYQIEYWHYAYEYGLTYKSKKFKRKLTITLEMGTNRIMIDFQNNSLFSLFKNDCFSLDDYIINSKSPNEIELEFNDTNVAKRFFGISEYVKKYLYNVVINKEWINKAKFIR